VKTVYSYDELDQVSKIETKNSAGVVLSSMTYERTGVGEPSKITREDGSFVTYGYDSALRLTKESYFNPAGALQNEITYGYDASGKRISKNNQVYAYNNAYQLQTVTSSNGAETYGYDADGRVSAINRDGQTLNLSHDSYDRLTQANDVTYLYDGSGNRIKAVSGASERKFLQASNGGLAITELLTDAAGNVISDYVYGNGSTPISKIDASGNSVYYLTDAMGSVIGEVDGDGNLITRIQYDGFGNVWSQSGGAIGSSGGDFRFQGQWLESDSGLYYFRARDYDSKTGLFLSRDAVAPSDQQPESMNPYQFAYQNPLVYSDPTGMFSISEINASEAIQNILNKIYVAGVNTGRQEIIDRARGVVGGILQSLISRYTPIQFNTILSYPRIQGSAAGSDLGELVASNACRVIGNTQYSNWLWLEAKVDRKGRPHSDGFNCGDLASNNYNINDLGMRANLQGNAPVGQRGIHRPDFIIKEDAPFSQDRKRGGKLAWLVGDVKLRVDNIDQDVKKSDGQWRAIMNYAKTSNRHQAIPIAMYITLYGGTQLKEERIKAASLRYAGVLTEIVSFFNNRGR
jgi:RHS repeat-associated protein